MISIRVISKATASFKLGALLNNMYSDIFVSIVRFVIVCNDRFSNEHKTIERGYSYEQ